ncbi:hypothetical protein BN946_scf184832.g4 [Trametes cinnabarina]|uniref:Uncharacterized protein n=1 Tax=Pycnoporus cinnabarinus TaxID=5643 RepID=A0A060SJS3_PYCCI|nr:hypothetical protein BN946_scf184832.g4 [Trametes cinnabarina]
MFPCVYAGCAFTSTSRRGLTVHRAKCPQRSSCIVKEMKKREAEEDDEDIQLEVRQGRPRKRARIAQAVVPDAPGAFTQLPPVPSPPRSRGGRHIRVPKHLRDFVPLVQEELPAHLLDAFPEPVLPSTPSSQRYHSPAVEDTDEPEDVWETPVSTFGTYRRYSVPPQRDPEACKTLESVCDAPYLSTHSGEEEVHLPAHKTISWLSRHARDQEDEGGNDSEERDALGPFDNPSQFRLFDWHYNASLTKSKDDFDDLLDVLRSDGFSVEDLDGFSAQVGQDRMDAYVHPSGVFSEADGWFNASVEIPLPKPRTRHPSEAVAPHFTVGGIHHRRLTDLIRAAAEDTRFAEEYHWIPHMYFWQPSPDAPGSGQPSPDAPGSARDDSPPPGSPGLSPSPQPSPSPSPSPSRAPREDGSPFPPDNAPPEPSKGPIRIFTDVYNSDAALQEFETIRTRPRNPTDGPDVEYVMAPLLLWSDATHLTSFGSASLWPIYLYFGALSKYVRGMPTEFTAHHIAYIPSLPDDIQDFYMHVYGTPMSSDILTFCKRELMQRIWLLLLDDDFLDAYENGILVTCGDGITRRIFPHILTYSADYPEKILLTALKPLSKHPCPRCLVPKDELCEAGTPDDMHARRENARADTPAVQRDIKRARKLLFKGASLGSKRIQMLLDSRSLNPVESAFSTRLSRFGLNHYQIFAPDLMHEFELGVWKNTFIHLLRLLAAQGGTAVQEFNRRMRMMPTFGRDTIRKFWHDVSARKQLAARDFEDFLACVLPAFEGLLPVADDLIVADMLFELANWHGLAKLRLHTSITIKIMRVATDHMCRAMRSFARTTCKRYETRELPKETDARVRCEEKNKDMPNRTPKVVRYNVLNTYKYHSLPDYPDYIEQGGTTDNYNSQVAELEHRHAKRYYRRTNKIGYALQIAKHQRRATLLRALRDIDDYVPRRERLLRTRRQKMIRSQPASQRAQDHSANDPGYTTRQESDNEDDDHAQAAVPPLERYAISQTRRVPNFIPLLRAHIFGRLMNINNLDEVTPEELDRVRIENSRIYRHKVLRVNYTTYDMRREQDVINPRTHPNLMVHAQEDRSTPYWYGQLIDIFHAYVRYDGPGATEATRQWQRIDILWVRWYENDAGYPSGFQERRLPRLRFVDANDPDSVPFGFVDPHEVIRAAHLMPAFAHGTTGDLLGPSPLARRGQDGDGDYEFYYVGIFADRDMFMRHLGGGVGHRGFGVSLAQSEEHALCRERTTTPEPLSDNPDESEDERIDRFDLDSLDGSQGLGALGVEEGEAEHNGDFVVGPPVDEEAVDEYEDEGWHFDVGLGGLADQVDDEAEDAHGSYFDDDGFLVDAYAMEGFAPL